MAQMSWRNVAIQAVSLKTIVVLSISDPALTGCVSAKRKGRRKAEEKTRKEGEHLD